MIWASAKAKCGSPCWIWLPSTIAYLLSGLYSYFQPEVPEEVRWSHATLSPQSRPALLGDLQWNFWWSCGMELPELEKGRSPKRRWKWTRIEAKMWCEYVMRTFFFCSACRGDGKWTICRSCSGRRALSSGMRSNFGETPMKPTWLEGSRRFILNLWMIGSQKADWIVQSNGRVSSGKCISYLLYASALTLGIHPKVHLS